MSKDVLPDSVRWSPDGWRIDTANAQLTDLTEKTDLEARAVAWPPRPTPFSTYGLITQTQRFKAAVSLAGLSDLVNLYGQFDARERYSNFPREDLFSAVMMESAQDRRAIRRGKRAEFVRYWGEGHALEGPANIRDMWRRIFA